MSVESRDINLDVFTSNKAYGSPSGGCDFGLIGNKEVCVQEIVFYLTKDGIERVMMRKQDQTCLTVGGLVPPSSQPPSSWKFSPDDRFKEIKMFCQNNRLVGVRVVTCKPHQRTLEVGNVSGTNSFDVPVGSGRCVGIFGNSGQYMDNLGFVMRR